MVVIEIIGVIALWLIAGFIINGLLYGHLPVNERRESETGRAIHILLNIATVILIFYVIFS